MDTRCHHHVVNDSSVVDKASAKVTEVEFHKEKITELIN